MESPTLDALSWPSWTLWWGTLAPNQSLNWNPLWQIASNGASWVVSLLRNRHKVSKYGVRGRANDWIKSYLSNRDQYVNLNDCTSSKNTTKCGVPQGSILGPLLFIIYINDMNKAIKDCITHHFADDTNLLYAHKDPKMIRKIVNKDLALLFQWLCANRLSLNVAKT